MTNSTTFNQIAIGVSQAVAPLRHHFGSIENFSVFMSSLGWDVTEIPTAISDLNSLIDDTSNKLDVIISGDASAADYLALINSIKSLTEGIYDLKDGLFDSSLMNADFPDIFPKQLLDYIIIIYLNDHQQTLSAALEFLGIIKRETISANDDRPSYILKEFKWTEISNLFSNPLSFLENTYSWNGEDFDSHLLFEKVNKLLWEFGVYSVVKTGDQQLLYKLSESSSVLVSNNYVLDLYLFSLEHESNLLEGIFELFYLPATDTALPGLGLKPIVKGGFSKVFDVGTNRQLLIKSNLNIDGGIALLKRPNERFVVKTGFDDPSLSEITGNFNISLTDKQSIPKVILGDEDGSRIEYGSIDKHVVFELNAQQENEFRFEIPVNKLRFVLNTAKGDSFINNIIPNSATTLDMDLVLGYSTIRGFYFEGSGGLEFQLPLHQKVGPVMIESVTVSVKYDDNLDISVAPDITLDLGAIIATVSKIGISGAMSVGNHGSLGGIDFNLGFKPPSGVGLSIDAPPVKGGGFLNYDESTSTYTGGLELQFSKISFSAIGIISTKLPGGEPGYSLLVIVSVEFTPLQIGMGFTINGIGGLLGLHRTSSPDVLRSGIRYNTLEHILFPKNIVENANTIISNLGQAFPIRKDQFMLGPMAKIGWGTPTLLTIDIGIVIEMPDPVRLLILGILRAQLPSEQNAILRLQVNFLGIIDFKENYLSFDATLYDSKILTFGLFGDMALRLNWGNRPNFLLSVGGFHPSYTPPPLNLPSMQRLTIVLADEKNLKISVESYFAVTSNSAQFGARVYAMARVGKFSAEGELWFNVLFQFSPFYFAADMGVQFAIKMGSKTLIGIYVALLLEGPDPWRAQGQAAFKILFVKVKVRFDATFGRQRADAIEAVKVDELIKEALMLPDNWETLLPDQNNQMVAWRKEEESEVQSVDPSGAIKISQRVMPLNTLMEKFGAAAISDFNRYSINSATIETTPVPTEKVQDYFARNEFSHMNDEEKLSRDGYELFDSGVVVGSNENQTSHYAVHKEAGYEEITMDSGFRRKEEDKFLITDQRMEIDNILGYATRTGLSRARLRTTSAGPDKIRLSIEGGEFVLANRKNLQQVGGGISFANSLDAERYLIQQKELSPTTVEDWIIANRYELV